MIDKQELKYEQNKIDETIKDDYDVFDQNAYENSLGDLTEKQKEEVRRLEFSSKTKRVLASRVGYRCSNPECNNYTIGPGDDPKSVVILGEAAHIIGAIQDGKDRLSPKADSSKKPLEIIGLDNGIWLCKNCHKLIDSKTSTYTVEVLRKWKNEAEEKQAKNLESQPSPFIEEYVYPSISVNKGISTNDFENKEWCLLTYLVSKYDTTGNSSYLKFESDDEGKNFETEYQSWMSENAIDFKTCGIDFDNDWQIKKQALNKIINNLVGLVTMNNEGLDYGKKFDDFLEKLLGDDVDVCSKLIKKLSIL